MLAAFIFALGSIVGSFLNVVIDRLPQGQPLTGRSHCDNCQRQLTSIELIPLFSFLIQKGKCKNCKTKLSWQYPTIELLTALLFVITYLKNPLNAIFSTNPDLILLLGDISFLLFKFFVISSLLSLTIIDIKDGLLPDEITLPTIGLTLIANLALAIFGVMTYHDLLVVIGIAALIAFFFAFLIFITQGSGMGGGDIRLGLLIGLLLGWPKALIGLYVAFLTAAVVALLLIAIRKKRFGQTIPFGPFLVLGTYLMLFWGNEIQSFWFRIFGF